MFTKIVLLLCFTGYAMACKPLDADDVRNGFLDSFDYVLTDLDGVLWVQGTVQPKAVEIFSYFRSKGKKIVFLTNDDVSSRSQKLKKFDQFGIQATEEEIFTSSYCAALYLKSLGLDKNRKVYVSGMQGIVDEISKFGLSCLPIGPEPVPEDYAGWIRNEDFANENVSAVVIGFDYYISYAKLQRAMSYLSRPQVAYIATHDDTRFALPKGRFQAGAKGFVAAVSAVTEREPVITGKPSPGVLKSIREVHTNLTSARAIMIGDNLSTDILFGRKTGIRTVFVLTGVNTLDDMKRNQADPNKQDEVPDYYTDSLESFYYLLTNSTRKQ